MLKKSLIDEINNEFDELIKMQEIKRKGWEYGKKQKIDYFYGQWGYHFR